MCLDDIQFVKFKRVLKMRTNASKYRDTGLLQWERQRNCNCGIITHINYNVGKLPKKRQNYQKSQDEGLVSAKSEVWMPESATAKKQENHIVIPYSQISHTHKKFEKKYI